ncbi:MAG: nucleotidyltransferase family protein [Candidatus Moranbacteria bacterium]|nr:nucleotidyltransferase family protein [Candidatus Moranbacteria bacterium]
MQAVILAAGKGTRMKELTKNSQKTMLEVGGKPVLAHKLDAMPEEIDEVIFIVGYFADQIRDYFGDEYNEMKIKYAVQEELNGTAGAIHAAKDILGERFMVMMGDDLYHPKDLKNILKNDLAILAHEAENPIGFGVFDIDENENLISIVEKNEDPERKLINTGLYVLNKKFFDYDMVPISDTEFGLPQTLVVMAKDYPVKIERAKLWQPIGNPDELKKAEEVLEQFKIKN